MSQTVAAALSSWSFDPWVVIALLMLACVYVRGFRRLALRQPQRFASWRCWSFLLGLATFLFAVASPIDAFADLLLQIHMAQHLLLMMVAPPLVWMGAPINPLLEGLPRGFLKRGLGPFLAWPVLQRFGAFLVHPVTAWLAFAGTTWLWHAPALYELALRSPFWHDVEHLCFFAAALLFWFPVVAPWPSKPVWPRAAMLPYLVLAALQTTAFSALFAFSGRLFYPTYADMPRLWGISALEDQAAAGAVMWVPSSVVTLVAVSWLVVTSLESPFAGPTARTAVPRESRPEAFDLLRVRGLGRVFESLVFRRVLQSLAFGIAVAIVVDGLIGPQLSPLNLAGVLPWTHWRGLVVIGLLVAGNWFCFACPFTLPRRLARRVLGAKSALPPLLQTKWLGAGLFFGFLVAYEAFDLWDSPFWTAWIVVGYFAAAFAIDGLYGKATFCRSLCPIGQFQFLGSTLSPLEVTQRDVSVCGRCTTHECLRGSQTDPGCDLDLFQPAKLGNLDCTFCLDCVRACPHDNVGVRARWPAAELVPDAPRAGTGRLARRPDLALFALLFCFGAFANAAGMIAPVQRWQGELMQSLGIESEPLLLAALGAVALLALPWAVTSFAGRVGVAVSGLGLEASERREAQRRLVFALVPLGFAMWLAHFSFHWVTAGPSIALLLQRAPGGSELMTASLHTSLVPAGDALVSFELTALALGLWGSLFVAWRVALDTARSRAVALAAARSQQAALGLFAPWGALAFLLWALGIWILFQPMEMRGMGMG